MSRGLGEILVKIGVIDQVQLAAGLSRMEQWGGNLLGHLVQARMVSEEALVDALAQRFRYEVAHPLPLLIERSVLDLLPGEFCERFFVLPIGVREDGSVLLAVSDPSDLATLDAVRAKIRRQVEVAVAGPRALADAIQSHYFGRGHRSGTPDPFTAGADSFGQDGLLPPVDGGGAGGGVWEIELPAEPGGPEPVLEPVLEPVASASLGDGYLPADDVAPRPVTGSGYLSDESEVVDVGDIFADHAALQSQPLVVGTEPTLAEPGAPADDVETDEPDPVELEAARAGVREGRRPRGNEMPTGELPMHGGDLPRSVHSTEGDLVVVAAEAVSEAAADRMEAQKQAVAAARAAATGVQPTPGDAPGSGAQKTVVFGSPVAPGAGPAPVGKPPVSSAEADMAIADARSISPAPPPSPDTTAILAARCEALEMRLGLLTDLLVEKGLIGDDDL